MKFSILPGRDLSSDLIQTWREIQQTNPDLRSPFFCPEFTLAIAAARNDVEVAVIEENGKVAGFFSFQLGRNGIGTPVGGILSDYHGIICAPDFTCDPLALLKACSLIAWDFDHLVGGQRCFGRFQRRRESSPLIDLSGGFERYLASCRAARTEQIKLRRLERALGSVRIMEHHADPEMLRRVLAWKSAQYRRGSVPDLFSTQWIRGAIERIHAAQTPAFAGMLSVLYAGDTPIAGHFGMRSLDVWHYWFPAYAPEHSRYSPGLVLLLKMAESAAGLGLQIIDLGKGQMLYKERFKNAEALVTEGSVECFSFLKLRRQLRRSVGRMLRETSTGAFLKCLRALSPSRETRYDMG